MRYLGLDLGTKTLGVAISDKTNTLSSSLKVIKYDKENYEYLVSELKSIILEYKITNIALGYPKNMNNTIGISAERSLSFKEVLEKSFNIEVELIDERLSTIEAENILLNYDLSRAKRKKVIDAVAAMIILDTYIKKKENV